MAIALAQCEPGVLECVKQDPVMFLGTVLDKAEETTGSDQVVEAQKYLAESPDEVLDRVLAFWRGL